MKDTCNLYVSFSTSVVHWSGRAHTNIAPVSWTENTESFSQVCFEVTRSIEGQLIYETMYSNFCNFKLPHQDWRQWHVLGEHLEECGIGFQCFGDSVWNNWVLILVRINIILYFIAARNHRSSTSFKWYFKLLKRKGEDHPEGVICHVQRSYERESDALHWCVWVNSSVGAF